MTAQDEGADNFSGFDALLAEFETDPAFKQELVAANKWVAEKFYGDGSLADLRLHAGLSQRELADACGIGQPHIARYDAGRVVPGLDISAVMAKALGVETNIFEKAWQVSRALNESAVGDSE